MAGLVLCVMASLAGVPPFLGFWAKLAVLRAAVQGDMLWLAIVGVIFAVVGAFYYLRVIKAMYFDEPEGQAHGAQQRPSAAHRVRSERAGAARAGPGVEPDHGVVPARFRGLRKEFQRNRRSIHELGVARIFSGPLSLST